MPDHANYPVLVTDGLWRKSLSAIRSLGKAGFEVHVMGETLFTTGFWSRYTSKRILAPIATRDPDAFGSALIEALRKFAPGKKPVLFAMEDATLRWVAQNRALIESLAIIPIPSLESLETAWDKARTFQTAKELGIPCPGTWEPCDPAELARLINTELSGREFVVKPRTGSGSSGISYNERRSLAEWTTHWKTHGPLLLQERVPASGRGAGVSLLMDQTGRCVARFSHERLQQYPVSGGPSTDRHSVHHPELEKLSTRLLEKLGWRGVAMVEWKLDPRDGTPKLMEINPRFWGSLELAVRSGIDFPKLYASVALGEKLPEPGAYPAGVRCRWMMPGEILRWLGTPASKRESLSGFFRGLPGLAEEWDPQDLRGALATLICTGALAFNFRYWKFIRRG